MQDYGLAVHEGSFDRTLKLLRLLYSLFAILKKPNYLRAIGYHFLLLEYHEG